MTYHWFWFVKGKTPGPQVEQERPTFPDHMHSPRFLTSFSGFHVRVVKLHVFLVPCCVKTMFGSSV